MPMKKSKENRCQCCNKCLTAPFHLVFDEAGKHQNIAALLFDYLGKLLKEEDEKKYAVCDHCLQQLIQCYEFKQKCIRANEVSSDEGEMDENREEEAIEQNRQQQLSSASNRDFYGYNEYMSEYQTTSEGEGEGGDADDMNVEYLEESFEDDYEEFDQSSQVAKKKIPFDFSAVLVKPVFALQMGELLLHANSQKCKSNQCISILGTKS